MLSMPPIGRDAADLSALMAFGAVCAAEGTDGGHRGPLFAIRCGPFVARHAKRATDWLLLRAQKVLLTCINAESE